MSLRDGEVFVGGPGLIKLALKSSGLLEKNESKFESVCCEGAPSAGLCIEMLIHCVRAARKGMQAARRS